MFEIQIKIAQRTANGHLKWVWESIHPTYNFGAGLPYLVPTIADGEEFARKWYPDCILNEDIRIIASGDLSK